MRCVWYFHLQKSLLFAGIRIPCKVNSYCSCAAVCLRHGAPASNLLTMMNGSLLPVMNSHRLCFIFCFIKRSIDPLSWQSTLQHLRETAVQDCESTWLLRSCLIHKEKNFPKNPSSKVNSVNLPSWAILLTLLFNDACASCISSHCAHFKEFGSSNCFINSVMNSVCRIVSLDVSDRFTGYNHQNQHDLFNRSRQTLFYLLCPFMSYTYTCM